MDDATAHYYSQQSFHDQCHLFKLLKQKQVQKLGQQQVRHFQLACVQIIMIPVDAILWNAFRILLESVTLIELHYLVIFLVQG
jgi:hypothetical protein